LYSIPTEYGISRKLVGLIKMCLNETYSRVLIGKNLSNKFRIQNGLKQGHALSLVRRLVWKRIQRKRSIVYVYVTLSKA
jgi:hypothetical protein